uniref:Integral membrane protein n=1 Tax=Moniliophthora roreri TaxID=221103 RepID=A0A0W0GBN6_MONRR
MPNSSVTEEDISPFDSTAFILVKPMASLTVMFYVYGIYTVLFIISLHILVHQQNRPNRVLYMFFTIVLFTLTSAYIVAKTFSYAYQATLLFTFTMNQDWASFLAYSYHDNAMTITSGFTQILPLCLVTVVDLMLLHRCYVIWGSSKWIAFPFIFMILSLTICEIVASVFEVIGISNTADLARWQLYLQANTIDTAFWLAEMGVNIILTLLTAGRICTIVAIILESGILYPIFLTTTVVYSLLADPDATASTAFSFQVVTFQLAGIAPTLIIIRAASGKTVEHTSMNQVVSSLHFASGAGSGSRNLNTRSHVQTVDIEARLSAERIQNPGKGKFV